VPPTKQPSDRPVKTMHASEHQGIAIGTRGRKAIATVGNKVRWMELHGEEEEEEKEEEEMI
jgi:hypothetical protein